MTFSKDLKPKGEGGILYANRDFSAIRAEIEALKAAAAKLENQLSDMADLTSTATLKAGAVQTHDMSASLAVTETLIVEGEFAVSNGSGQDKDVIVNRNGLAEWGTPTNINAENVLVADTVERATTVDHSGIVNTVETVNSIEHADTLGSAGTVGQAETVNHAGLVEVADVISQTGDAQINGTLAVSGNITQKGETLDNTYINLDEKGIANGVATLDAAGRIPSNQLTIDAMQYKGKWDAATNTPALANGTGTRGDFYISSSRGTVNFGSGAVSFLENDRVLYNGTEWEKVPAGEVASVNGKTGDVEIFASDIEGTGSLTVQNSMADILFVDASYAGTAVKPARGSVAVGDAVIRLMLAGGNTYAGTVTITADGTSYTLYIDNVETDSDNYILSPGMYLATISADNKIYVTNKAMVNSSILAHIMVNPTEVIPLTFEGQEISTSDINYRIAVGYYKDELKDGDTFLIPPNTVSFGSQVGNLEVSILLSNGTGKTLRVRYPSSSDTVSNGSIASTAYAYYNGIKVRDIASSTATSYRYAILAWHDNDPFIVKYNASYNTLDIQGRPKLIDFCNYKISSISKSLMGQFRIKIFANLAFEYDFMTDRYSNDTGNAGSYLVQAPIKMTDGSIIPSALMSPVASASPDSVAALNKFTTNGAGWEFYARYFKQLSARFTGVASTDRQWT